MYFSVFAAETNAVNVRWRIIVSYGSKMYKWEKYLAFLRFFCVCLFAILNQNFEAARNHVEIWQNCRLDEYLIAIFLFLKIFFLGPRDPFFLKDLGHPREFKIGTIMIKYGTFVD